MDHPGGSASTHGMAWALGTAWAIRIMVLFVPHVGVSVIGSSAGATIDTTLMAAITPKAAIAAANTTRRGPQRCSEIGARAGPSSRNSATRSRPSLLEDRSQLRRAGDAACCGERLGDLVRAEVRQRSVVDARSVGAHSEDEHHVGEVDRLTPGRRTDLREGDVDHHQVAVDDEQVRRLDVTVGEPGIPESPHERQALVDDLIVDLGVADLLGAVHELGDEHVLTLGCQFDDPQRRGCRDAGVAHQPQGVVLVLDEAAHRRERCLVLQPAVQDGAAELVPAIGSHVVQGVELPEHKGFGITGEAETKRRRPAGTGEAHRAHFGDDGPQLILDGAPQGVAATAGDVEVRLLPAVVGDRNDLAGGEVAEGEERHGDTEGHAGDDVEGMIDGEVQPSSGDECDQPPHRRSWRSSGAVPVRRPCR